MSDTKTVYVNPELLKLRGVRRTRGSTRRNQVSLTREGGGSGSGAMAQMAASSYPGSQASINLVRGVDDIKHVEQPRPIQDFAALPTAGGDHKEIKVELKRSTHSKKVHLNPKKISTSHLTPSSTQAKTKKNRKITLGLSSLHKRLTRAKKIKERVREMPILELRQELVKRGLIKQTSKAPESILRQIAADAQIVGGKAL
jgi:hypothetical protein